MSSPGEADRKTWLCFNAKKPDWETDPTWIFLFQPESIWSKSEPSLSHWLLLRSLCTYWIFNYHWKIHLGIVSYSKGSPDGLCPHAPCSASRRHKLYMRLLLAGFTGILCHWQTWQVYGWHLLGEGVTRLSHQLLVLSDSRLHWYLLLVHINLDIWSKALEQIT